MIRNYLKIAWRNLRKKKVFSFINIFGLALGLSCFILIGLYVADELSYDRFHENADRIYRIDSEILFGGTQLSMAVSADPMGATLKKDYPQVEQYVRLYASSGSKLIKNGDEFINESRVVHADSTLFDVFTLPLIAGNNKTALSSPNTVVITESAAERYFGSAGDAIGQTLQTNDAGTTYYEVTAVIEDLPEQSHFDFDFFFSMENVQYNYGNFLSHNFHTYVLLRPDTDYREFNQNFTEVIEKYILPQAQQFMQIDNMEDFQKMGNRLEYSLMPLTDIHLHSSRGVELGVNGNIQYVYLFSLAALFILIIACVNFMNLSTARSAGRAKEVGIRKTLGTRKKTLISQFLIESILMAFIALLLALVICGISLSWFNGISGKEMELAQLLKPAYLIPLLVLPILVGALAGTYPAFYLSSFKPIAVLQGKLGGGARKEQHMRSVLVVFQFTISIILIIGTIVIYDQLDYIRNSDVGFDKEQVLTISTAGLSDEARRTFKNEVAGLSTVEAAAFGGYLPVSNSSRSDTSFSTDAVMTEDNGFNMQIWRVDYEYIPFMGIEVLDGRNFSLSRGTDSTALVINEKAVELMGVEDPVGKQLFFRGGPDADPEGYTVIGVVKNFNFASLRQNVGALAFRLGTNSWVTAFRIATNDVAGTIGLIEAKFNELAPGMPFNYEFLDEAFDNMYRQEQRVGQVALTFAILAILIACLGLFGLATYIAEQRTKEIGIRKVLGASVANIVRLLSKDFLKLVLIAFVIGSPVAWWAMHSWLEDFAYRVPIGAWIFLATGGAALGIALLTVAFKAVRAALANPVNSLRTE